MSEDKIYFKKGYKYQIHQFYKIQTKIYPNVLVKCDEYLFLTPEGMLTIRKGYAFDGPSGPAIDTDNFMRGSLVHDALYQLMRKNLISKDEREYSDKLLVKICKEDGMSSIRCWWVYRGLRWLGNKAASSRSVKKVYEAP